MTETREIKCDACGADLTYTGNCEDYYLVLSNAAMAPWYAKEGYRGGAVTAMAVSPAIKQTQHFCGLHCLDRWRDREKYRAKLWHDWREQYRSGGGDGWPQAAERDAAKIKVEEQVSSAFPKVHR
jgi:hypothetical protein